MTRKDYTMVHSIDSPLDRDRGLNVRAVEGSGLIGPDAHADLEAAVLRADPAAGARDLFTGSDGYAGPFVQLAHHGGEHPVTDGPAVSDPLATMPGRLDEASPAQLEALQEGLREFVDPRVLQEHHAWHRENLSGGTLGPGSGEEFLTFHRGLQLEAERSIGPGFQMPEWENGTRIPPQFTDPMDDPGTLDDLEAAGIDAREITRMRPRDDDGILPARPGYLTPEGGPPLEITAALLGGSLSDNRDLVGRSFSSLGDFESLDELGRVIGLRYHGAGHNVAGGAMMSFASPTDAAFFGWHQNIDGIVDDWLNTDNGQRWAADNPNHPIFDPSLTMRSAVEAFE